MHNHLIKYSDWHVNPFGDKPSFLDNISPKILPYLLPALLGAAGGGLGGLAMSATQDKEKRRPLSTAASLALLGGGAGVLGQYAGLWPALANKINPRPKPQGGNTLLSAMILDNRGSLPPIFEEGGKAIGRGIGNLFSPQQSAAAP